MPAVLSTKKSVIDPRDLPDIERATMRRIFSFLRPYRRQALLVIGSIVLAALCGALPPLLLKRVIDQAIPQGRLNLLFLLCGGMALAPLLAGLLGVAQRYLAAFIAERVMFDLRVQLFRHVQRQSLNYFASAKSGEVVSRVLNDVQGVGHMMQENLVKLLQNAMVFAVSTAVIFSLDWRLALVAFALLPAFIYPARKVGRTRKALKRRAQARMAEMTGILLETLSVSGALLLKVFGTEKKETKRLKERARELMEVSLRHNLVGRWFQMLMKLFEELGPVMVWAAGGWLVVRGSVPLGTIVAFVALLRKLYSPASDLAGVHVDVVTSYAYFDRIFAVLDLEPTIRNAPDAIRLPEIEGGVSFKGVSFSYRAEEPLLRDIELDIAPGERVAIVGPSGAGKSTLSALVPRLYDPNEGAVLVDGHDVRTVRLRSLRSHIGVVTQQTYLFHASILDNLRYARPDAPPRRSRRPPAPRRSTTSSPPCPTATRPSSASAAIACRAGSSSGWPSRARCSRTRRS